MSERKTMFTEAALIERDVQTARAAIADFKRRLTEQGIPIDKLLSGEMVAVESDKLLRSYREEFIEPAEKAIAQLDYAGNPPVEPAGATHSEKSPITWTWDRD